MTTSKCQHCKRRKAVWRTGSDGFAAKAGKKVCNEWVCRDWASGGWPVSFYALEPLT
jgi:hypothetical protein